MTGSTHTSGSQGTSSPTDSVKNPSDSSGPPILIIALIAGVAVIAFLALLVSVIAGFLVRRRKRRPRSKTVRQTESGGYTAVPINDTNSHTSTASSGSAENRVAATNPMVCVVDLTTEGTASTATSSDGDGASLPPDYDSIEPSKKTDLEDMEAAVLELSLVEQNQPHTTPLNPPPDITLTLPDDQTTPDPRLTPRKLLTSDLSLCPSTERLTPDLSISLSVDHLTSDPNLTPRKLMTPDFSLGPSTERLTPDLSISLSVDQLTSDLALSAERLTPDLTMSVDRLNSDLTVSLPAISSRRSLSVLSMVKVDLGALASDEETEEEAPDNDSRSPTPIASPVSPSQEES